MRLRFLTFYLLSIIITSSCFGQTTTLRYVSRLRLNLDTYSDYLDSIAKVNQGQILKNGQEVEDTASREALARIAHAKLLAEWSRVDSITSYVGLSSSTISAIEYNADGSFLGTRQYKIDSQSTFHRKNDFATWSKIKLQKLALIETSDRKKMDSILLVKFETADRKSWMWVQKMPSTSPSPLPYPIGNLLPGLVHEYLFTYDKLIVSGHLCR